MASSPGLYLHVPFCSAICPYCDFAVTTGDAGRRERFVEAMIREIETVAHPRAWGEFDTVYLGGGTPSALRAEQIGDLLAALDRNFTLTGTRTRCGASALDGSESVASSDRPMTSIEVNPEDVTAAVVGECAALGVDRLSLGVQSFDDDELRFLGRRHRALDARRAVEIGRGAGLVVSIDLIYGLPGQSPSAWRRNLETAVSVRPDHLSCYQLTIEPGTPFYIKSRRGDWTEPDNDELAELFYLTHRFLADAGYPAYEVSNFARSPEVECDHNRKYWEGAPYLGLGPSAHSFDGRSRWWNERSERAWRRAVEGGASPVADREKLDDRELALERVMLGLRTPGGVDLSVLGVDLRDLLAANRGRLERFAREGLVRVEGARLIPTLDGMARADALARAIEL